MEPKEIARLIDAEHDTVAREIGEFNIVIEDGVVFVDSPRGRYRAHFNPTKGVLNYDQEA